LRGVQLATRTDFKKLLKFLFEAGALKKIKRSGWWIAKVKDPESVAEHSFRTAVIAFVLAKEEGADAEKAATEALFHDFHETRIEDRHKIQSNYFKTPHGVFAKVARDQGTFLPEKARKSFLEHATRESEIVRDADALECALQAREYFDIGYESAWEWLERPGKRLRTKTAKKLWRQLKKTKSDFWWDGLKEKI